MPYFGVLYSSSSTYIQGAVWTFTYTASSAYTDGNTSISSLWATAWGSPEEQEQAEERAQRLLAEVLGQECLGKYQAEGNLHVESPSKRGLQYVITPWGAVEAYQDGVLVDELCLHLVDENRYDTGWLPPADVVLGKALLLKWAEEPTLAAANHYRR